MSVGERLFAIAIFFVGPFVAILGGAFLLLLAAFLLLQAAIRRVINLFPTPSRKDKDKEDVVFETKLS